MDNCLAGEKGHIQELVKKNQKLQLAAATAMLHREREGERGGGVTFAQYRRRFFFCAEKLLGARQSRAGKKAQRAADTAEESHKACGSTKKGPRPGL